MKNFYFKVIFIIVFFSSFLGGSFVLASDNLAITKINVPLSLQPNQSGTLIRNLFGGIIAQLEVPVGAIGNKTFFKINGEDLVREEALYEELDANLFGGQIFNIRAINSNGEAIHDFLRPLIITLEIPKLPFDTSNLGVYYYRPKDRVWVLMSDAKFYPSIEKIIFSVDHLTKFAIFELSGKFSFLDTGGLEATPWDKKEKVLGAKNIRIKDESLLRGSDKKIYIIKQQKKKHILNLKELDLYIGLPILDVEDSVLDRFSIYTEKTQKQVKGNIDFKLENGMLIRASDNKIYLIEDQKRKYIPNLEELRRYAGKKIKNVSMGIVISLSILE